MQADGAVSSDLTDRIKRSVRVFLESEPEVETFGKQLSQIGEVAIFGGVPRDLSRNTNIRPDADVDLVVDCEHSILEQHLRSWPVSINKFNGFRIQLGRRLCDVWAASETWAVKQGHRRLHCFNDITTTTFFSCDQVLYNVTKDYVHATEAFVAWHKHRVVALNLADNPNREGMAGRIVRILNDWEHAVDRDIVRYFTRTIEHRIHTENACKLPEIWTFIYHQAKDFENTSDERVFFLSSKQSRGVGLENSEFARKKPTSSAS